MGLGLGLGLGGSAPKAAGHSRMVGSDCRAMPRAAEASEAEPRRAESVLIIVAASAEQGTAMLEVMIRLPAATVRTTAETGEAAMAATLPRAEGPIDPPLPSRCCCQLLHAQPPRLPLAWSG